MISCQICRDRPKKSKCMFCGTKPKKLKQMSETELLEAMEAKRVEQIAEMKQRSEEEWLKETREQMTRFGMKTTGCPTLDERVKQYFRSQH